MKSDEVAALLAKFEALVHTEQGVEFWFARELQVLLGYDRWENLAALLDRARTACAAAGPAVDDHFRDVTKMVRLGSGAERAITDVAVTRYGCYLLAQNGDPRKEAIAFAQTYFAVQTRKQELIERRLLEADRVRARARLVDSEKQLSAVIFERVRNERSFARIRSKGDRALFGGLTTQQMKGRIGVPGGRALADFLPTVTIKAKDFANEMTVHNTRERDLRSEPEIAREHVGNNSQVRTAMTERGIVPERLPAAEDVKKVARRVAGDAQQLPQGPALPPDPGDGTRKGE
jgi:DNA-damage-inducible protein D